MSQTLRRCPQPLINDRGEKRLGSLKDDIDPIQSRSWRVQVVVMVVVMVEVVIEDGVGVRVGVQFRTVLARGSTRTEPRKLDGNAGRGALAERVLFAGPKFGSAGREVLFLTAPVLLVLMKLKPL